MPPMAEVVKVTTKGQLTLPARIRRDLGISEDTYLLAEEVGDFVVLRRAETRFLELSESFQKEAKRKESPGRRSYELSRELVEGDLGEVLPRFERPRFRHRVLRYGAVDPPGHVPRRTYFRHLSGCSARGLGGHAGEVPPPTRGGQGSPVTASCRNCSPQSFRKTFSRVPPTPRSRRCSYLGGRNRFPLRYHCNGRPGPCCPWGGRKREYPPAEPSSSAHHRGRLSGHSDSVAPTRVGMTVASHCRARIQRLGLSKRSTQMHGDLVRRKL